MGVKYSPQIVTSGLMGSLDIGNPKSYISGSITWKNVVDGTNATITYWNSPPTVTYVDSNPTAIRITQNSSSAADVLSFPFIFSENCSFEVWYKTATTGSGIGSQTQSPGVIQLGSYNNNASLTVWDWSAGTPGIHYIQTFVNNGATWSHLVNSGQYTDIQWINKYHQIILNFSGSLGKWNTYNLYIDKILRSTINFTIPFPSSSIGPSNIINAPGAGGGVANNSYAILRYYNRTLSTTEILQNYNAMKGRFNLT